VKNIIIAEFKHETNRFSPTPADEGAFRKRFYLFGEDIFSYHRGVKGEMGGILDVFSDKSGYRLIPTISASAMPSGPVVKEIYDRAMDTILTAIRSTDHVDGVLLSLHGAMVSEVCEDGEGFLLEAIRKEVGPDVPIISTLDLHANVTEQMQKNADGFFGYDYYPHTDLYETGVAAAQAMYDTLEGKVEPVLRWRKLDLIQPYLPTSMSVMKKFVDMAQEMRRRPGVLRVNICSGFFHADIEEQGVAIVATTDGDAELAQSLADELGDAMWADRNILRREFYTADQAIDEVLATEDVDGPIVLADVADNPGAGGSCDSTHLLRRLIERKVPNVAVAMICDPQAVQEAEKAGVGNTVTLDLGGKVCPEICGEPIHMTAYVKSISDGRYYNRDAMGQGALNTMFKTAVLVVDGIEIIVSSHRPQPYDLEVFRSQGIMPQDKKVLVVKSTIHYRASYGKIAHKMLDVETSALAAQSPRSVPLKHCRRPIYPLDDL